MPKAAATTSDFAERLDLALKVLNVSRAQLAARVGVDKSLVSRWLSGPTRPTGHNLTLISELLAKSAPGFNASWWERPRDEFERLLSGAAPGAMATPTLFPVNDAPPPPVRHRPPGASFGSRALIVATAGVAVAGLAVAGVYVATPGAKRPPAAVVPPAPALRTLAVMPFANLSGDRARDYFSNGFSEELRSALSDVGGLQVASRTDSMQFQGRDVGTAEIGKRLKVGAVVEGTVLEAGDRVRITAQLVNAATGFPIWRERFDRATTDMLRVQDEIAVAIAGALSQRLLSERVSVSAPSIDPQAYRDYLRGSFLIYSNSPASLRQAIPILRSVTVREPKYVDGFSRLGAAHADLAGFGIDAAENTRLSEQALRRALAIDPTNARANSFLINIYFIAWRWREALALTRSGLITQGPGDLQWGVRRFIMLLNFHLYRNLVLPARAAAMLRPDDYALRFRWAAAHFLRGEFEAARVQYARATALAPPEAWAVFGYACANDAALGKLDDAAAMAVRIDRAAAGQPTYNQALCRGAIGVARNDLAAVKRDADLFAARFPSPGVGAAAIALLYQQAGDFGAAARWYQMALERREMDVLAVPFLPAANTGRVGAQFVNDPRWLAIWNAPAVREWRDVRDELIRSGE